MNGRCYHRTALPAAALLLLLALPRGASGAGGRATRPAAPATSRPAGDGLEGRLLKSAGSAGADGRPVGPAAGGIGPWLRTLGALVLVGVLVFALRVVLKRMGGPRRPGRRADAMEVVAQAPLAGRQQLALVRLGRRLVLVGTGPTGMSALAEVTDPAEVAELLAEVGRGGGKALERLTERGEPNET